MNRAVALLVLVVFILAFTGSSLAVEPISGSSEIADLKAELEKLRTTVAEQAEQIQQYHSSVRQLQKELAEQKKRAEELEDFCQKHGIDPTESQKSPQPKKGEYLYRGHVRSQAWFERNYRILCDKIACIDGKYIDISQISEVSPNPPNQQGEIRRLSIWGLKILQVLTPGEALIEQRTRIYDGIFHVTGLSEKAVDGVLLINYTTHFQRPDERGNDRHRKRQVRLPQNEVNSVLVYRGLYNYRTPLGGSNTVGSYEIFPPMTREQFADALAKGFTIEPILQRMAQMEREAKKKGSRPTSGFIPGRSRR